MMKKKNGIHLLKGITGAQMGSIIIKRIYDKDHPTGLRILVDRLWPRGISKDMIDEWHKEIAPSNELRKWFSHEPEKFSEFKEKYFMELNGNSEAKVFADYIRGKDVILYFGAKDEEHNHAIVLKEWLEKIL